jgi:hypothetical protein
MRTTKIALLAIVMVALMSITAMAADNVIGKAHIKKGTDVAVFIPVPGQEGVYMPFNGTAFKDQTFYILEKIKANDGSIAYKIDGHGFSHDCPAHGEEIFNVDLIIIVIESQPDFEKNIKIEIFKEE